MKLLHLLLKPLPKGIAKLLLLHVYLLPVYLPSAPTRPLAFVPHISYGYSNLIQYHHNTNILEDKLYLNSVDGGILVVHFNFK